ncbi:hypothetical protein A2Y83_04510 [Candidatus Falkowbacteria bacterium RBG_13_39_14]|uniref:Uncharacterized protein n=1 Tax=Candidatus Falkowbacteria bacterium RBG_13_39_14 TaxID=1797985 RepID=A0A1F5S488_9BACT|nr:MAG: hypothetical protein A2Y83_04510 [Candidatus Falkowbacteria bacterium RBG_13_39_14]
MLQIAFNKRTKISFNPSKIKEIFDLSAQLSKLTEELLEENALYSKEFLTGLEKSEKNLKEGRTKEIKSLQEIF